LLGRDVGTEGSQLGLMALFVLFQQTQAGADNFAGIVEPTALQLLAYEGLEVLA